MKDSLLRVIDDLETKLSVAKESEKSAEKSRAARDVLENMFCSGVVEGLQYAIKELRKVLDDHGN